MSNPGQTAGSVDEAPEGLFHPATFTLANGMECVVISNHRAPVVAHMVWYRVGTADSPPGKSGLPHFLEHLMFKGTEHIAPGEFSKVVARNGGNDNAFTGQDFTAYFQMIAKDRLPLVMGMEADRMVNLRLSDELVYPERDVIVEERRSRVDNEPGSLLAEELNAAQYLHHPYRLPVIGWLHEIEGYRREDAEAFYRTWYAPNNAILVVCGDITAEELQPLAEAAYGAIPARPVPERRRLAEPPQHAERRIALSDERVRQPNLIRSYLAPGYVSIGSEHAYALSVLGEALGGGDSSRLYRRLVVDLGLAAGVGTHYNAGTLDRSTFRIYATPQPGADLEELESALDVELARVVADGFDAAEVARTQRRLLAEAIYARDSLMGAAQVIGVSLTTGQSIADIESWPARIHAVTAEQVHAAARYVFDRRHSVTARLLTAA